MSSTRAQELYKNRGGGSWAPVPNKPKVSVDLKQYLSQLFNRTKTQSADFRCNPLCQATKLNLDSLKRRLEMGGDSSAEQKTRQVLGKRNVFSYVITIPLLYNGALLLCPTANRARQI